MSTAEVVRQFISHTYALRSMQQVQSMDAIVRLHRLEHPGPTSAIHTSMMF
jgi:hypothetical protein